MHAYELERITLLLSSYDYVRATDPTLAPVINRTFPLLSSFDYVRATDPAVDPTVTPAINPVLNCTGTTLECIDPILNLLIA